MIPSKQSVCKIHSRGFSRQRYILNLRILTAKKLIKVKKSIMLKIKTYRQENKPNENEKETILNFLFENLEQYGDPKKDIEKCMNYALQETPSFGGFVLTAFLDNKVVGAVIVNET